ncbi:hypothetical protein [Streptomyces sp. NPDC001530]|uniref:hypothetical protein n=1 Tax=Streptomyces sp. NPDC001530 TaxID=3364582 RepID=UPI0036CF0A35
MLAATAAVLAITLGAFVYGMAPFTHKQPPSRVVSGDVPGQYVGTWKTTINADHNRRLVIKQGRVGDVVMSLTADGPGYHCAFQAKLVSVEFGSIRLGKSTVTAAHPADSCVPGDPTTVVPVGDDQLRRDNDDNGESLTYTRVLRR